MGKSPIRGTPNGRCNWLISFLVASSISKSSTQLYKKYQFENTNPSSKNILTGGSVESPGHPAVSERPVKSEGTPAVGGDCS